MLFKSAEFFFLLATLHTQKKVKEIAYILTSSILSWLSKLVVQVKKACHMITWTSEDCNIIQTNVLKFDEIKLVITNKIDENDEAL